MNISEYTFQKHIEDDKAAFGEIHRLIADNNIRREAEHAEIMEKFELFRPVYEAFDFKAKLSKETMLGVVKWSKIIGLILSIGALIKLVMYLIWNK